MSRHAHRPRPHRPEGAVSAALAALGTTLSWSQGLARFDVVARRLERVNFRGRTVSLRGGVGVAAGAVAASAQLGRILGDGVELGDPLRPGQGGSQGGEGGGDGALRAVRTGLGCVGRHGVSLSGRCAEGPAASPGPAPGA